MKIMQIMQIMHLVLFHQNCPQIIIFFAEAEVVSALPSKMQQDFKNLPAKEKQRINKEIMAMFGGDIAKARNPI